MKEEIGKMNIKLRSERRVVRQLAAGCLANIALMCCICVVNAGELQIRPRNFIVTPSTGPVAEIVVKNGSDKTVSGVLKPSFPSDWKVSPLTQQIELKAGESQIVPFAIEKGSDLKANVYPVKVSTGNTVIDASVVCASTPYYKPEIDGKLDEWADAIPVEFITKGKKTVVRSYWNKKQFCLAVEVEEEELIGLTDSSEKKGVDAVQFALSPGKSVTADQSVRYEYLVTASNSMWTGDKCFKIMSPGESLSTAKESRKLKPLFLKEAAVKVKRTGNITTYEIAVPMKAMKTLRATAGREYNFSLLVHDPDGTGIRDLGSVMNLWPEQHNAAAWSNWELAKWNGYTPFDNKVEFGFCSSIH